MAILKVIYLLFCGVLQHTRGVLCDTPLENLWVWVCVEIHYHKTWQNWNNFPRGIGGAGGVDFLSFVTIVTVGCSKHCSIQYCNVFSKPGHGVAQGDTKSYSGTSYEHNQHVSSRNKNETVTMDLETRCTSYLWR